MSVREKVMDKYWLEFLDSEGHIVDNQQYHSVEGMFWKWFNSKRSEFNKRITVKIVNLDDYLK